MYPSVFSKGERAQIINRMLPLFKTADSIVSYLGSYFHTFSREGPIDIFSKEERRQFINHMISAHISNAEEGRSILSLGDGYWLPEERSLIINKAILPHFDSVAEADTFLEKWHSALRPEDIYEIGGWMIFHFKTAEEGIKVWNEWGLAGMRPDAERQLIKDKTLSLIKTSEQGVKILYELEFSGMVYQIGGEEKKELIMNKTASLIKIAPGTTLSDEERYEMVRQVAKTSQELNLLRSFLSDHSYRRVKSAIRRERFNCRIQWIKQQLPFTTSEK